MSGWLKYILPGSSVFKNSVSAQAGNFSVEPVPRQVFFLQQVGHHPGNVPVVGRRGLELSLAGLQARSPNRREHQ